MDHCSIVLDLSGFDSAPRILVDFEQLNGLDMEITDLSNGKTVDINSENEEKSTCSSKIKISWRFTGIGTSFKFKWTSRESDFNCRLKPEEELTNRVKAVQEYLHRSVRYDTNDMAQNFINRVKYINEDFRDNLQQPADAIAFVKSAFAQEMAPFKFKDLCHIQSQIERVANKLAAKVDDANVEIQQIKSDLEDILRHISNSYNSLLLVPLIGYDSYPQSAI